MFDSQPPFLFLFLEADSFLRRSSNALLLPLTEHDRTISIYLDAAEFIDWKALVIDVDEYRLVVDSRFVIVRCPGAEEV